MPVLVRGSLEFTQAREDSDTRVASVHLAFQVGARDDVVEVDPRADSTSRLLTKQCESPLSKELQGLKEKFSASKRRVGS